MLWPLLSMAGRSCQSDSLSLDQLQPREGSPEFPHGSRRSGPCADSGFEHSHHVAAVSLEDSAFRHDTGILHVVSAAYQMQLLLGSAKRQLPRSELRDVGHCLQSTVPGPDRSYNSRSGSRDRRSLEDSTWKKRCRKPSAAKHWISAVERRLEAGSRHRRSVVAVETRRLRTGSSRRLVETSRTVRGSARRATGIIIAQRHKPPRNASTYRRTSSM